MGTAEEKLASVDQALYDLGKSDEEISAVRERYSGVKPDDLESVDAELSELGQNIAIQAPSAEVLGTEAQAVEQSAEYWEGDNTEVEVIDEADFVLLVDEEELEDLEKVGEDDAKKAVPPSLPPQAEQGEQDEGFFKKLFGGRTSNRPP